MATPVNALLSKLLAAYQGKPDKVPKGHLTIDQWAAKWGKKRRVAAKLIRAGVKAKLMQKARYKIRCGKVTRPTDHYFEA